MTIVELLVEVSANTRQSIGPGERLTLICQWGYAGIWIARDKHGREWALKPEDFRVISPLELLAREAE